MKKKNILTVSMMDERAQAELSWDLKESALTAMDMAKSVLRLEQYLVGRDVALLREDISSAVVDNAVFVSLLRRVMRSIDIFIHEKRGEEILAQASADNERK